MNKEELKKKYMEMPWFRHKIAERYKMRENTQAMQAAYSLAKEHGKLVEESDGQFTGGGRHELYEVSSGNVLHEFLFEEDFLVEFTIYDKETYYG